MSGTPPPSVGTALLDSGDRSIHITDVAIEPIDWPWLADNPPVLEEGIFENSSNQLSVLAEIEALAQQETLQNSTQRAPLLEMPWSHHSQTLADNIGSLGLLDSSLNRSTGLIPQHGSPNGNDAQQRASAAVSDGAHQARSYTERLKRYFRMHRRTDSPQIEHAFNLPNPTVDQSQQPDRPDHWSVHPNDGSSILSWPAEASKEGWATRMCKWISKISSEYCQLDQACIFITPSLSLTERVKAHYIAHNHGLYHMSVRDENDGKCVVVSPYELTSATSSSVKNQDPRINLRVLWLRRIDHGRPDSFAAWHDVLMHYGDLAQASIVSVEFCRVMEQALHLDESAGDTLRYSYDRFPQNALRIEYRTPEAAAMVKLEADVEKLMRAMNMSTGRRRDPVNADYAVEDGAESTIPFVATSCYKNARDYFSGDTTISVDPVSVLGPQPLQLDASKDLDPPILLSHNPNTLSGLGGLNSRPLEPRRADAQSIRSFNTRFSSRSSLGSHASQRSSASMRSRFIRVTEGYECGDCGKLYDRRCDRDKHWRNVHGARQHACPHCGKGFVQRNHMARHADKCPYR